MITDSQTLKLLLYILTPELAAICVHKVIVISGILTADGKLEQISVKKTPDTQVNQ